MAEPIIVTDTAPDPRLRDAILQPLIAYNNTKIGTRTLGTFAIVARDPGSGAVLGGLWARTFYDWMLVELLVVPETMRGRGVGASFIGQAEAEAHKRGCVGIYLDTFSFQARGFYEKLGYRLFGTLENYPDNEQRFFLQKRLKD